MTAPDAISLTEAVETIDRYCTVWSSPDPRARAERLATVWADGATYTDPTVAMIGAEPLLAHIARVQGARPGTEVARCGPVDVHHRVARFRWRAVDGEGRTLVDGLDVVTFDDDGRLASVVGFFDEEARRDVERTRDGGVDTAAPAPSAAGTARVTECVANDRVRVTRWDFAARGDNTGWHRHAHDYVVVPLTDGTLEIADASGVRTPVHLSAGEPYYRDAGVEHDVINGNDGPFAFVETEIVTPR